MLWDGAMIAGKQSHHIAQLLGEHSDVFLLNLFNPSLFNNNNVFLYIRSIHKDNRGLAPFFTFFI